MYDHGEENDLLPKDPKARKEVPLYSGLFAYFPLALIAVSKVSQEGSEQHHPGKPLHWDRAKSADHRDCLLRHLMEGDYSKVAWRALALCQIEAESCQKIGTQKPNRAKRKK